MTQMDAEDFRQCRQFIQDHPRLKRLLHNMDPILGSREIRAVLQAAEDTFDTAQFQNAQKNAMDAAAGVELTVNEARMFQLVWLVWKADNEAANIPE